MLTVAMLECVSVNFTSTSQDTAELFFEDVRLPKEALLGGEETLNKGFYFLMNQLPRERLVLSLSVQAHTECMFEMTKDYLMKRKAFGKTLSKLQVNNMINIYVYLDIQVCEHRRKRCN